MAFKYPLTPEEAAAMLAKRCPHGHIITEAQAITEVGVCPDLARGQGDHR